MLATYSLVVDLDAVIIVKVGMPLVVSLDTQFSAFNPFVVKLDRRMVVSD